MTDWLPTFYSAAGGNVQDLGPIDGVDQWNSLRTFGASSRKEMLYNSNSTGKVPGSGTGSALRLGDMKLIIGEPGPGFVAEPGHSVKPTDDWISEDNVISIFHYKYMLSF